MNERGLEIFQIFLVLLFAFSIHEAELILHATGKTLECALFDTINNTIGRMSFRDFQIVGVLQNCTKVNVIDIQLCCCEHRDDLRM